jgi:hypothetical protein
LPPLERLDDIAEGHLVVKVMSVGFMIRFRSRNRAF